MRSSDAPRINVARPADPDDPYLTNWIKGAPGNPGPATFNGIPCSFPGRVWKSKVGAYWNMVCAKAAAWPAGGSGRSAGWARYTTSDPSLMSWTPAPEAFVQRDGKPVGLGSCSGAYFQKLPGGVGPYTHIIQSGCNGASFFLGTYNHSTEVLTLTSDEQSIVVDDIGAFSQKDAYHWGAAGREEIDSDPNTDTGRMFTIAWVSSTAWEVPGFESLVRELAFDAAAGRLTSVPLQEYTQLRNATHLDAASKSLAAGARWTLNIPSGSARGALDILISFELGSATPNSFGVAVRAPLTAITGAALLITVVNMTDPDPSTGTRNATILFTPPPIDPRCKVGTQPCKRPPGYKAQAVVPVLAGEAFDLRVLVDRPVIEAFAMSGRTSYVTADTPFTLTNSSVHIFNDGSSSVHVKSVSAFGMGCGWSPKLPKPALKTDLQAEPARARAPPPPPVNFNLSNTLGDHMVLQRTGATVWGVGVPGAAVSTPISGTAVSTPILSGCEHEPQSAMPFCDAEQPTAVRVRDLVRRLSLAEKVGQLSHGGAFKNGPAPAIARLGVAAWQWGTECLSGERRHEGDRVMLHVFYSCPFIYLGIARCDAAYRSNAFILTRMGSGLMTLPPSFRRRVGRPRHLLPAVADAGVELRPRPRPPRCQRDGGRGQSQEQRRRSPWHPRVPHRALLLEPRSEYREAPTVGSAARGG
jgi:hypothetical protein